MSIAWNTLTGEELLKQLQEFAVLEGLSDIHVSPEKHAIRLEVRRHGMLERLADLSRSQYDDFTRRLKFITKLKLNLTTVPQDGQYTFSMKEAGGQERSVNVRVASLPTRFGETFTMRLLDPAKGLRPLEELGFPSEIDQELRRLANIPNGLILVTGPTGSGKTTTLYALLQTIVGTARNIISLEDPIEYELAGIVQSQVDPDHDFTFAAGLRSILRHDPDVVLVGEIRDLETAQTAVDAALTGHMVFSTLHTNSAIEAIPRLLSMGVSPYTFAPALRGVLAQRLVRTLKPELQKKGATVDPMDSSIYGGRTVLPELLTVDDDIRNLILQNETADTIEQKAVEHGYRTMLTWGGLLINEGRTTRAEIDRVTA